MEVKQKQRVAIDFDGVIRKYGSDAPCEGAKEAIDFLRSQGYTIIVYTARSRLGDLIDWLRKYNIHFDEILGKIVPVADFYICPGAIDYKNWKSTLRKLDKMRSKVSKQKSRNVDSLSTLDSSRRDKEE